LSGTHSMKLTLSWY